MRKIIILITTVFLLACTMSYSQVCDEVYAEKAAGHILYEDDRFLEIETPLEISAWVNNHITYQADAEDSWDNPKEILDRGYGDCDDFTILVMNIAYVRFGIEFDLVLIDTTDIRAIEEGGSINHATIAIDDWIYNVYDLNYIYVNVPVGYRFSFWQVFAFCGLNDAI